MKEHFNIIKSLGSGAVSDAYLIDGSRVLLVGKSDRSYMQYKQLCRMLKIFKGKTFSVKISCNLKLVKKCKQYPYGALVQDCLPGESLQQKLPTLSEIQKQELGSDLAVFAQEVHNTKCKFSKTKLIKINLHKYTKSLVLLKTYLPQNIYEKLCLIKLEYKNFLQASSCCLTHGDLNPGNILLDNNNKLCAILDFGNMEYYVKEVDFAAAYSFDKYVFSAMLQAYSEPLQKDDILLILLAQRVRHFKNIVGSSQQRVQRHVSDIIALANKYTLRQNSKRQFS